MKSAVLDACLAIFVVYLWGAASNCGASTLRYQAWNETADDVLRGRRCSSTSLSLGSIPSPRTATIPRFERASTIRG